MKCSECSNFRQHAGEWGWGCECLKNRDTSHIKRTCDIDIDIECNEFKKKVKVFKKILRWFKYKKKRLNFSLPGPYTPISLAVKRRSTIYEINNFAVDLEKVTLISYTQNSVSIQGAFTEISFYIPEDPKAKEIYDKLLKAWKEVR